MSKWFSGYRLPWFVARRYLFSRKRIGAINLISGISVLGVAFGTAALLCTLSVFNGFSDLIGSLYTAIDPELVVEPAKGKMMASDDPALTRVRERDDVEVSSFTLTDHALILFSGHPTVITLKGVDDNYDRVNGIRGILYGEGSYKLHEGRVDYGIPGIGLASQMGGINYGQLEICAPRKGEQVNLVNPSESFNAANLQSPGVCFDVRQNKYDVDYMITSLGFAQNLFEQQGCVTALELKMKPGTRIESAKGEIREMLGERFKVSDRNEQQEEVFSIMRIEKAVAYMFLTFILLIACFNIIGSVSMLIIDKRDDVLTLRHLGASEKLLFRIFLYEGRLISLFGAVIGVVVGLGLCLAQQYFGIIRLGSSAGNFIIDAYPVSVHWGDVVLVLCTVVVVGFVSVWYPVKFLTRRFL